MDAPARTVWGPLTAFGLVVAVVACIFDQVSKLWLLNSFDLANKGVAVKPWVFDSTNRWQEIDFHLDVSKAKTLLANKIQPTRTQGPVVGFNWTPGGPEATRSA